MKNQSIYNLSMRIAAYNGLLIFYQRNATDISILKELIQKYIPEYQYSDGMKIRTNFYKCGDNTELPHYGIWNPIPLEEPDFHQPDYLGEVVLDYETVLSSVF